MDTKKSVGLPWDDGRDVIPSRGGATSCVGGPKANRSDRPTIREELVGQGARRDIAVGVVRWWP